MLSVPSSPIDYDHSTFHESQKMLKQLKMLKDEESNKNMQKMIRNNAYLRVLDEDHSIENDVCVIRYDGHDLMPGEYFMYSEGDEVLILKDGKFVEFDAPDWLLNAPKVSHTGGLVIKVVTV